MVDDSKLPEHLVEVVAHAKVRIRYRVHAPDSATAREMAEAEASEDDKNSWLVIEVDEDSFEPRIIDPATGGVVVWERNK